MRGDVRGHHAEDENYVEYQTAPSGAWHAAKYAEETVCRFIRVQFDEYVAGVRKADCEADLRRRIGKGPPIWLADKHALPVPDDDTHVCRLWLARTGREYSAKLKGALEGDARQKLWDELSAFMPPRRRRRRRRPGRGRPGRGRGRQSGHRRLAASDNI